MIITKRKSFDPTLRAVAPATPFVAQATSLSNEPLPVRLVCNQLPDHLSRRDLFVDPTFVARVVEGLKSGTAFEAIRAIASSTSAAYSRQSSHVVDPCGTLRTPSER